MGLLGTGVFATSGVGGSRWDGREILGMIQGNTPQLLAQGLAVCCVAAWSIVVTWLLFQILRPRTITADPEPMASPASR